MLLGLQPLSCLSECIRRDLWGQKGKSGLVVCQGMLYYIVYLFVCLRTVARLSICLSVCILSISVIVRVWLCLCNYDLCAVCQNVRLLPAFCSTTTICLSVLSVCQSVVLPVFLDVCVRLSGCFFLSVCLSVFLSVCLLIGLSVRAWVS